LQKKIYIYIVIYSNIYIYKHTYITLLMVYRSDWSNTLWSIRYSIDLMIPSWSIGQILIRINRTFDRTSTVSSMIDQTLSRWIDHPINHDRSIGSIYHLIDYDRSIGSIDHPIDHDISIGLIDHPINHDRSIRSIDHSIDHGRSIGSINQTVDHDISSDRSW